MDLLARSIGNALGLWLAVALVGGLSVPGTHDSIVVLAVNYLVLGAVLAVVNSLVKPLKFLAFPLYLLTFGLFALVANGLVLMLTSAISQWLSDVSPLLGLHVAGLGSAIAASLIVSIISAVVVGVIGRDEH